MLSSDISELRFSSGQSFALIWLGILVLFTPACAHAIAGLSGNGWAHWATDQRLGAAIRYCFTQLDYVISPYVTVGLSYRRITVWVKRRVVICLRWTLNIRYIACKIPSSTSAIRKITAPEAIRLAEHAPIAPQFKQVEAYQFARPFLSQYVRSFYKSTIAYLASFLYLG